MDGRVLECETGAWKCFAIIIKGVMMYLLEVENLKAGIEGKELVSGVSLKIKKGEVHVIMGQNGTGKSTLLSALAGSPKYTVKGKALLEGRDLLAMKPHERARNGMFLSFQNPTEVAGVPFGSFLHRAYVASKGKQISVLEFEKLLSAKMAGLGMEKSFSDRGVNEGFSGGEKKRGEVLQMAMLEPKLAMLDEIDSGLDVDALSRISEAIEKMKKGGMSVIIVTHYARILKNIKPDFVHVMSQGRIIASGDARLAHKIEEKGYGWVVGAFGETTE